MKPRPALRGFPVVEAAVLAVAVALIVALDLAQEHPPPPGDSYSTYDAAPGGLRAWYELLGREGVGVTRFEERAAFLDRATHTLVVAAAPPSLVGASEISAPDGAALAAWVRSGGRLVVVGAAPLMDTAKDLGLAPRVAPRVVGEPPVIAPALRRLGVERFAAPRGQRLGARPKDQVLLADRFGRLAVGFPLGRGAVVQVLDGAMLRNGAIGRPDHARLAYAVAVLRGGPVAFDEALHGYLVPEHWWQIFPRRLVVAILLCCVVLAVALVGSAVRLGPPRPAEPERAPHTGEYIDALATLMQRGHAANAAVRQSLHAVRRLAGAHARAADDATAQAYRELNALAESAENTDAALLRGLSLAYGLRKEYGPDARAG
jgi:hypothetical protein